jgi:hypothetical protein
MTRTSWCVLLGGLLTACSLTVAGDAHACGGCFAPAEPPTVVSGHRMVMSVSPSQSVLWDQIQYAGDPAEFAWVLPVKPGARVEASTAAFFEVLEAQTAVAAAAVAAAARSPSPPARTRPVTITATTRSSTSCIRAPSARTRR